jgi:isoquinoline 1-oxidoreductase beta subunit
MVIYADVARTLASKKQFKLQLKIPNKSKANSIMKNKSTRYNRRSFLKVSATAGGGLVLGFTMFQTSCNTPTEEEFTALEMPDEWFEFNPYLKIGDNGVVTIYAPNAEFGQNVRTSMPMLVAEELDIDWKKVVVEQAMHAAKYGNQFTGFRKNINRI